MLGDEIIDRVGDVARLQRLAVFADRDQELYFVARFVKDELVPLEPAGDALITGADVIVPPGALVLNATPFVVIPNESESITAIKARYP